MRFEYGKSYLWLFAAYAAIALGSAVTSMLLFRRPLWAFPAMSAMVLFLLVSQLRSGIALDGMWRAIYRKETWMFKGVMAANSALLVFFIVTTVLVFTQFK
jgi:hypothetical protein